MDQGMAVRSKEDVALDLLKFVAAQAHVGGKSGGAAGFVTPTTAKSEDQVEQLLELYGRCRAAVEKPMAVDAVARKA